MAYLKNGSKNEIIVSAGALGSPQILMLSGIGLGPKLKAQGIEVVLDQPMVGQGMSDNPINGFFIPIPRAVQPSLVQVVGITHLGVYIEAVSGPFDLSSFLGTQVSLDHSFIFNPDEILCYTFVIHPLLYNHVDRFFFKKFPPFLFFCALF